jgi:hypothetical protein
MCDYCSCRTVPVIAELAADHEALLELAARTRAAIAAGDRDTAARHLGRLIEGLHQHTATEEAGLFRVAARAPELLDVVHDLEHDHTDVWRAVGEFGDLASWDRQVRALVDDRRAHIAREEYDLFPATLVALGPAAWEEVSAGAV